MSDFAEDHAAGAHQEEIVALMRKIEPCMHGHPRAIIIITLIRLIAAMLGPASKTTREEMLHEIPKTIRSILREMDRMIRNSG
jgi:hypothetical protein